MAKSLLDMLIYSVLDDNWKGKRGEKLVVRVAKRGNNAGKSFYGCSAFPKCKYTQEI